MGFSTGCSSLKKYTSALPWGPLGTAVLMSAPAWSPWVCREISALADGPPPPPPSSLILVLHYFSLLFSPPLPVWLFLPILKSTFTEVLSSWLLGPAGSCGGVIGAVRNWLCPAWGSPGLCPWRACSP